MRKNRKKFATKKGLRQEGVVSPILFIMIMDDEVKEIKAQVKQIHIGGYENLESSSACEEQEGAKIQFNVMEKGIGDDKHEY